MWNIRWRDLRPFDVKLMATFNKMLTLLPVPIALSVCLPYVTKAERASVRILDICYSCLRSQSSRHSSCTSSTCFAYCLYFSAVLFMQSVDGSILDSIALLSCCAVVLLSCCHVACSRVVLLSFALWLQYIAYQIYSTATIFNLLLRKLLPFSVLFHANFSHKGQSLQLKYWWTFWFSLTLFRIEHYNLNKYKNV